MTSNVGARELKEFGQGVGFTTASKQAQNYENMKSTLEGALRKVFRPEFLNRIDDVIVFNSLTKEHMMQIIDIAVGKVCRRVKELGFELDVNQEVKEFLVDKGFDEQYGARPLNRAIQKYLEDPIADEILHVDPQNIAAVRITLSEDKTGILIHKELKDNAKSQA
jgi:ATP-dependent Clp protease ATP-binding subunit ClpC